MAIPLMIYERFHSIRHFLGRPRASSPGTFLGKGALLVLCAAGLARADGDGPTVTPLPYVLTNNGSIMVVPSYATTQVPPPSASASGAGDLLGGGLASVFSTPSSALAAGRATLLVRNLVMIKKEAALTKYVQQLRQDTTQAKANEEAEIDEDIKICSNVSHVKFNHLVRPLDSSTCTLPEQQVEENAQEELQALTQEGNAAQEEIEGAEEAVEAAEAALEATEVALEAAEDAVDVFETILELVGVV
jgi:hypothetical protein